MGEILSLFPEEFLVVTGRVDTSMIFPSSLIPWGGSPQDSTRGLPLCKYWCGKIGSPSFRFCLTVAFGRISHFENPFGGYKVMVNNKQVPRKFLKMTALEIKSIIASCNYSNRQCFSRDKKSKGQIFLDHLDYLSATKFSMPRAENMQNAHMETDEAKGLLSLKL